MTHTPENIKTLPTPSVAEEIKRRVQPFLVSRQRYDENLSALVSSDFLDLKVCYCIPEDGGKMLLVSNKLLETHGIPADSVKSQALENLKLSCCYGIQTLDEMFARMGAAEMLPSPDPRLPFPIYALTNTSGYLGAAGLLLDGLLADFAEMIEDSFFVIPSSIHEILLVPGRIEMDIEHLNEIIRAVNISQVSPDEALSDHAYYYDRETGQLQTELIRKKQ